MNTTYAGMALTLACLLVPAVSFAERPSEQQINDQHRDPPAEALEA
jgi:hypothetical protein